MNKAFKRYRKARWINTRLAKQYKFELMLAKCKLAAVAAQAVTQVSMIKALSIGDPVGVVTQVTKAAAIAQSCIGFARAVSSTLNPIHSRWRVSRA